MDTNIPPDSPIFILGILPRSGTNLLYNLLKLHPDCGVSGPIWEDYLLEPSGLLLKYARAVYEWWDAADPPWGIDEQWEGQLCQYLGQGAIAFFKSRVGAKRILTKTPSVSGLENFFQIFNHAYLLILVRDGRDLVESAARSFGWDRDGTSRGWAEAARIIQNFDKVNRGRGLPYLITRFEDLYTDLENELRKILNFVKLDTVVYDFEEAIQLPVYGSSTTRETEDRVHWKPLPKKPDFNPIGRSSDWSRTMHERFNWLAGSYLAEFGYKPRIYPDGRRIWTLYNRSVDAVQRYRPYRFVPPFAWRLIKKAGYRLLHITSDGVRGDT